MAMASSSSASRDERAQALEEQLVLPPEPLRALHRARIERGRLGPRDAELALAEALGEERLERDDGRARVRLRLATAAAAAHVAQRLQQLLDVVRRLIAAEVQRDAQGGDAAHRLFGYDERPRARAVRGRARRRDGGTFRETRADDRKRKSASARLRHSQINPADPRRTPSDGDEMAEHLASIFGTEKDRVNCPFYFKVRARIAPPPRAIERTNERSNERSLGPRRPPNERTTRSHAALLDPSSSPPQIGACRHGDRCSRLHNKPTLSQTILMSNMYQSPEAAMAAQAATSGAVPEAPDARKMQEHFEDFYEDIFEELATYGEIEGLNICDNLADHLVGNVYVKYREEESALAALNALSGRFYAGRPILCEFSPVTDFRESTCRQYEENTCTRGGYCNFMHLKPISRNLRKILFGRYKRRDDRDRDRDRDRTG